MSLKASEIDGILAELFPLNRCVAGDGNRDTLNILKDIIPVNIHEYPSGSKVYDWVIPDEWECRQAWIKNSKGEKIADYCSLNLHLVSYSVAVNKKIKFSDLKNHLHYLEDVSGAVPYRTSYYSKNWGFCLSYDEYTRFFGNCSDDEEFEVFIDSNFRQGSMSIGELLIKGRSDKEILVSTYICHPSMANDNLSGIVTTAAIARELLEMTDLEHSYRFVFVPETIGAIAYCANNEDAIKQIDTGLVVTNCGGPGMFGYKQSWDKSSKINDMVEDVFTEAGEDFHVYPFDIHGSDERQYSSQAFRVNCVSITKDKYYEFPFYHTSLDNLDFVRGEHIEKSINIYLNLISKLDKNLTYKNLMPYCEVMLSKYDLYPKTGGAINQLKTKADKTSLDIILELLFYCDGTKDLFTLSKELNSSVEELYKFALVLEEKGIMGRAE